MPSPYRYPYSTKKATISPFTTTKPNLLGDMSDIWNDENSFRSWYSDHANKLGLNPNPDAPEHYYDWRAAYKAGAMPNESGHWPSQFKLPGHPNRYVDGIDTITGQPGNNTINPIDIILNKVMTPEPERNILGMPESKFQNVIKSLGEFAYGLSPYSAGGRIGAMTARNITEQQAQPGLRQKALLDMANTFANIENVRSQIAERGKPEEIVPDEIAEQYGVPKGTKWKYFTHLKPATPKETPEELERKNMVRQTSAFLGTLDPESPYWKSTVEALRSYAEPSEFKTISETIPGLGITKEKEWSPQFTKWVKGGNVRYVDMNKPEDISSAMSEGFKEYEKPTAAEKPEVKPMQALKRITAIDKAVVSLSSGGSIDPDLLVQFPMLAAFQKSKDPQAIDAAIRSLQIEREELLPYLSSSAKKKLEESPQMTDDTAQRFNSDTSMKGNKLGKKTEKGYEVYKGNKLIGYYR